jgi:hypothetical protein
VKGGTMHIGSKLIMLAAVGSSALIFGLTQTPAITGIGEATIVNKAQKQSIPNRVATRVTWDLVRENALGAFTFSDPSHVRITGSGLYLVTLQASWQDCTCGYRSMHLQIDASPPSILAGQVSPAKWETGESLTWQGRLEAGQTLSVWAYQDSGTSLGFGGLVRPSNASANTELAISRIG